jgi:hypothetical protein
MATTTTGGAGKEFTREQPSEPSEQYSARRLLEHFA